MSGQQYDNRSMKDQQEADVKEEGQEESKSKEEFIPKAQFDKLKANTEILRRKLTKAQDGKLKPDDLLKDPEFRKKAFSQWEIPHDEEGNFKLPETLKDQEAVESEYKSRLKKARETWVNKELNPKLETLTSFEAENASLKDDVLISALERSAKKVGVLDNKFAPVPFGDGKTSSVHLAKNRFKYNPELKRHVMMDGENMALSNTGDPIFADDFFSHFFEGADDKVKREWLGDARQRGSGFSTTRPGGAWVMTRKEATDKPSLYRTRKEAAKKAGQKLTLID